MHYSTQPNSLTAPISATSPLLWRGYGGGIYGKELQTELGLNVYDYHARMYDPAIGRMLQIDPHTENYFSLTPYNYTANNPILFNDPDGKDYRINVYQDDEGNWHIDISTTVHVSGDNAENKVEEYNQFIAENADKLKGTFTNEDGTEFQISVNINYKVQEETKGGKVIGYEYGDNFLEFTDTDRSHADDVGARFGELGNSDSNSSASTAFHETLHMLGLGDRYYEKGYQPIIEYTRTNGQKAKMYKSYATGFEKDIMGGGQHKGNNFEIVQQHFDNWGKSIISQPKVGRKIEKGESYKYVSTLAVDTANNRNPE